MAAVNTVRTQRQAQPMKRTSKMCTRAIATQICRDVRGLDHTDVLDVLTSLPAVAKYELQHFGKFAFPKLFEMMEN